MIKSSLREKNPDPFRCDQKDSLSKITTTQVTRVRMPMIKFSLRGENPDPFRCDQKDSLSKIMTT
jgi:hypothetical protein